MSAKPDGIIIGTGIIGASIAYELCKKGFKTLNIDKQPAAGYGSTGDSCAIIRTNYSTLEGTALAYDSYFDWINWADYLNLKNVKWLSRFREVGFLVIDQRKALTSKVKQNHDELKIPYEIWDWQKIATTLPHFSDRSYYPPKRLDDPEFLRLSDTVLNGDFFFFPRGGYVDDPQLTVRNIQEATELIGGEFIFSSKVIKILQNDSKVTGVMLQDGRIIEAGFIVNAAGPHSFLVNRMAGIEKSSNIKTKALRREVHFLPSPEEFTYDETVCVVSDVDTGIYHRPESGNQILAGSLDPECDERVWIENPDRYNRNNTNEIWKTQVYRLANRIPNLPIPNHVRGIVGLYDVSDDWLPIYDRSDLEGFYLAIGTSGNQFKNGPVAGRIMAQIISACENGIDHDQTPVQSKLQNIDVILNTGSFSRNRDINRESTFSVQG